MLIRPDDLCWYSGDCHSIWNIIDDHGSCSYQGIVPYVDILHNANPRTYIDVVTYRGRGSFITANRKALRYIHIISYHRLRIYYNRDSMTYIETIAYLRLPGNLNAIFDAQMIMLPDGVWLKEILPRCHTQPETVLEAMIPPKP